MTGNYPFISRKLNGIRSAQIVPRSEAGSFFSNVL
jgi:hypothetical protein